MPELSVADVMTPGVESVAPETSFAEVADRMRTRRLSCVVVCEKSVPVGVISERDVVRLREEASSRLLTASQVMSRPVIGVPERTTVGQAVALLRSHRIRRLPVLDEGGQLAGIVTQTDLLDAYVRELEESNARLEQAVADRTRELRELAARFEALSLEDALLGIGNRRAMEVALESTHARALRYGRVYTLALLDVDHFKAYNDGCGHAEGDRALARVGRCLKRLMRGSDAVFRYGGEEILVLLPETDASGARTAAERLRAAVADLGIPHPASPHGSLTVSCGVAAARLGEGADREWGAVAARADAALYRAKAGGRNRVVVSDQPEG
jgi:diguanylate cyclase (GGDEF)-like protein